MVQTSNQWILDRTGISSVISPPEVATSDLAVCAAAALDQRIDAELNCILVCTVTPDMLFQIRPHRQNKIGRKAPGASIYRRPARAFSTDDHRGAPGSRRALRQSAGHRPAMSRVSTIPTAALAYCSATGPGRCCSSRGWRLRREWIYRFLGEIDGSGDFLKIPARQPYARHGRNVVRSGCAMHQDGQQVFRYAVRKMEDCRVSCCAAAT
jgi:hypothetical protein